MKKNSLKFKRVKRQLKKNRKNHFRKSGKGLIGDSILYLKESLNHVYLAITLFLISAIVAFIFPSFFGFFNDVLADLVDKTYDLDGFELSWFIFRNNITSAFLAVIFGVFLGIFPVFNALTNGALLGYVISRVSENAGLLIIWRLAPHGIFELPAIFIAIGLGIKLGMFVFSGNRKQELLRRFYGSMKVFFVIILPLLIIAAIIEGILISFS